MRQKVREIPTRFPQDSREIPTFGETTMEYLARVLGHLDAVYDAPPPRTRCRGMAGRLLSLCQRCPEWGATMGCRRQPPDETGRTMARLLTSETEWCGEWSRRPGR